MKTICSLIAVFVTLCGAKSYAQGASIQIYCTASTRAVAGTLDLEIKPDQKYLGYAFDKYHATLPSQNYQLSGSNQEGFGTSALSKSSVSIIPQAGGQTKIVGLGLYYDRATLVGKTEVEIILGKTPYEALGGYELISFKVDGVQHKFEGPTNCTWIGPEVANSNFLATVQYSAVAY